MAPFSDTAKGWVKGKPVRFVHGHIGGINATREYRKKFKILDDGAVVKKCTWCRQFRPVTEFDRAQHHPDRLRSHCRECHKKQEKARYKKNPGPAKQRAKKARTKARVAIRARLARIKISGCRACREPEACCIEFHHVVGGDQPVSRCESIPQLERELVKCALLCANCHKKAHAKRLKITSKMMCSAKDGLEETIQ
jgi:hypothetical protein